VSAQLRPMTAADLPAVLSLENDLFREDAWTREMFAAELAGGPGGRYYLVADDGGQLVGYAGLLAPPQDRAPSSRPVLPSRTVLSRSRREPPGQADVLTMAVATDHWGQGIGSALLQALLAEAAARNCGEVFLEVRVDNQRAQRLYQRYGFVQIGLRRGYYQPSGTDAIVMRCPVDPAEPTAVPLSSEGRS
jgi:[ribosomal protein S18]-alanine N-acetyltransferase